MHKERQDLQTLEQAMRWPPALEKPIAAIEPKQLARKARFKSIPNWQRIFASPEPKTWHLEESQGFQRKEHCASEGGEIQREAEIREIFCKLAPAPTFCFRSLVLQGSGVSRFRMAPAAAAIVSPNMLALCNCRRPQALISSARQQCTTPLPACVASGFFGVTC